MVSSIGVGGSAMVTVPIGGRRGGAGDVMEGIRL